MKQSIRPVAVCLLLPGLMFAVKPASAAAGNLDTTFGRGGVTVTTLAPPGGNNSVIPYSVKLQPDGKILVLVNISNGTSMPTNVLRYTTAGALDTTFGRGGIAALPTALNTFETMALQSNGQIVVAGGATDPTTGAAAFGVERLNSNGTADTTFGDAGLAIASLGFPGTQSVVLTESNGDILFCGQLEPVGRGQPFHTALARFTIGGALDTTFGKGGTVNVAGVGGCTALALLSSGEIQVVNAQATAQFTANGAPEPVTGGTILESAGSEQPSAANIFEPNGDYLFADLLFTGAPRGHNAAAQVLRFTPIGNPDPNFANPSFHYNGTGGSGIEASANGLAVAPNGDIVVVGQQNTTTGTILNGLARLTSGGTLDPTFGNGGTVANTIPAGTQGLMGVVIQPVDGKIVAIGTANNLTQLTISRYLGN